MKAYIILFGALTTMHSFAAQDQCVLLLRSETSSIKRTQLEINKAHAEFIKIATKRGYTVLEKSRENETLYPNHVLAEVNVDWLSYHKNFLVNGKNSSASTRLRAYYYRNGSRLSASVGEAEKKSSGTINVYGPAIESFKAALPKCSEIKIPEIHTPTDWLPKLPECVPEDTSKYAFLREKLESTSKPIIVSPDSEFLITNEVQTFTSEKGTKLFRRVFVKKIGGSYPQDQDVLNSYGPTLNKVAVGGKYWIPIETCPNSHEKKENVNDSSRNLITKDTKPAQKGAPVKANSEIVSDQ